MRPGPRAFFRQRELHHPARKLQKVQTEIEVRQEKKEKEKKNRTREKHDDPHKEEGGKS